MKSTRLILQLKASLAAVWILSFAIPNQAATPSNSGGASSSGQNEANALQGNRARHQTDLFTGSFSYSLPIDAAPARSGSEPHLALTYSSVGGNGWCGVGWNLEVGYIERYTKDGIPIRWNTAAPPSPVNEYDDGKGFAFSFFGRQGKLIATGVNEYRAEVEGGFMRFVLNTGANRWEVYDKSGNVYYFGQNTTTRVANTKVGWPTGWKGVFRWELDQVITATGDRTTISYVTDGLPNAKKLYPELISYNGHTSLATTHSVRFETEARSDKTFSYRYGFRVDQTRRLKRVICKAGVAPVRRYELTYESNYSPSTKRSRLQQIQVFGSDDSSTLPAQTFSYSEKPLQFAPTLVSWVDMNIPDPANPVWETVSGHQSGNSLVDLIDMDGDALPDRVRVNRFSPFDNFQVQRNRNIQADGKGHFLTTDYAFGPVSAQAQNSLLWWSAINSGYTRFLDIDGDGRPDRVMDYLGYYNITGQAYDRFAIERNTGAGFSPITWTGVDGLVVQGASTRPAVQIIGTATILDVNGDGIPDRVMAKTQQPYDYLMVQFGTGSGFLPVRTFGSCFMQGKTLLWTGLDGAGPQKLIDINGDGLPDRVMYPMLNTLGNNDQGVAPQDLNKFVVEFNNGYAFEPGEWLGVDPQYYATQPNGIQVQTGQYAAIESFPHVALIDINGDHLPDRVMLMHSDTSKWYVQINNGTSFEPRVPFSNVLRPSGAPDVAGWYGIQGVDGLGSTLSGLSDVNGDGLVDRVLADYKALENLSGSIAGFWVNLNQGSVPDLMTMVNNGIGGTVTVQYKPSTSWDNRKDPSNANSEKLLPFVIQTVSTVSASDGIYPSRTTTYEYAGGFFDPSRREFAGFACVTNTDPSSRKSIHWFHQGGGRDNAANGEFADVGNFAKKGIPYRVEIYGNDSPTPLLYGMVVNQVNQIDLGNGRRFPFIQNTINYTYPGGGTPITTATKFVYDSNTGNLTKKVLYGRVNIVNLSNFTISDLSAADTQYQQTSYAIISGNSNIKDHPSVVALTSDDAGTQIVQETKYTYTSTRGQVQTEESRISPGQYSLKLYQYNSYGLPDLVTDATGVQTHVQSFETTYNIYPRIVRKRVVPNANSTDDHVTDTTFDARSGLPVDSKDPMGNLVRNTYDRFYRLTQTDKTRDANSSNPNLWVRKLDYSLGGISSGITANYIRERINDGVDSVNGIEAWSYTDGLGRVIQTRNEAELATQFRVVNTVYDERGERFLSSWPVKQPGSAFTKPNGSMPASHIEFDKAGRVYKTRQRVEASFTAGVYTIKTDSGGDAASPLGVSTIDYQYASDPSWIVVTDAENKIRRYQLDGFGRTNVIHEVTSGGTYVTTLNYDLAGNLTEMINHNSEHIYFGYNDVGNVVAMADPYLGLWKYKYDKAGRLREQTDAKGQKIVIEYNASLGRMSAKKVYNSANQLMSTSTYTYDISDDPAYLVHKGLLYKVTDSEGWEKSGYDTRGRLLQSTRYLIEKNQTYTTTYGYNDGDRVTSMVYPNFGPTINYSYHPSGALNRVYRPDGYNFYQTSTVDFDDLGQVTQFQYGNGKVNTRGYFPISKRVQTLTTPGAITLSYGYNKTADITALSGSSVTYDDLHRIKTYSPIAGTYAYDAVGNITASIEGGGSAYGYGTRRPQAVKTAYSKTYLYDLCGNMIVRGPQALEYDSENRLKRLSNPSAVVVEYGYADDGQRLWKKKNQTELQIWIGEHYEEKQGKILFHVFAGDQRICTFESGSVLAGGANGSSTHVGYYYHQDQLNSSSALTGSGGELLEVNSYHPFGSVWIASPQAAFQVTSRFTGQDFDAESGLYYYNARYYDPSLGRFIQPDTIIADLGNPQTYNRYAYALNNPLRYQDPSGNFVEDLVEFAQTAVEVYDFVSRSSFSENSLQLGNFGVYGQSYGNDFYNYQILDYTYFRQPLHTQIIENWFTPGMYLGNGMGFSDSFVTQHHDLGRRPGWDWSVGKNGYNQWVWGRNEGLEPSLLGEMLMPTGAGFLARSRSFLGKAGADTTAQVVKNRSAGNAFRDEIAELFRNQGYEVTTEVYKRTPIGKRFIDIELSKGGRVLGGLETKVGRSRYTSYQRISDWWLRKRDGYTVNVVRNK